jgi:hypothetical protein
MTDPSKINPTHTQRAACVYARQSTPGQVEHNRESTAANYKFARAGALSFVTTVAGGLIVDWDHCGDCGQLWHSLCGQPDRSHAALDIQADLNRRPLVSVVHIAVAALA